MDNQGSANVSVAGKDSSVSLLWLCWFNRIFRLLNLLVGVGMVLLPLDPM